ncbi:hypothetical protein CISIN_1g0328282mg, partial [Citrus sinensis]
DIHTPLTFVLSTTVIQDGNFAQPSASPLVPDARPDPGNSNSSSSNSIS